MTALKTLLADPTQPIAFVAELTYRDPDTDTTSTKRITTPNWEGTESGYLRGLLTNPGTREVSIEADELGGIASELLNTLEFKNEPPAIGEDGPLDFLRDKSLAGRAITLLAGSPTEAISEYEEVGSGVADGEPTFDDDQRIMQVRRKSALERLEQDLDVNSYVGEPSALKFLVNNTTAAASTNAAFDLSEFTVAGRLRVRSHGGGFTGALARKANSSTDENYAIIVTGSSGSPVESVLARWSSSGVSQSLEGPTVNLNQWYTVVFARSSSHAYLLVDGELAAEESSPGAPDEPSTGVVPCRSFGGQIEACDVRIFKHYITPDEMRAAMAVRASGDENGLVGLWRGDDNTGGTLTDYSDTGADATISGTEDTDFEWVSSDLGNAELAGQGMPWFTGKVFNIGADLVDAFRERWRFQDRDYGLLPITVRDEGEELTGGGTDYTWSNPDPIVAMASEAGEPLTLDAQDQNGSGILKILRDDLMKTRGGFATSDFSVTPASKLLISDLGFAGRGALPLREVITDILRGSLLHVQPQTDGTLRFDGLVSPTSPSPRDGSCLEIVASTNPLSWGGSTVALSSGTFSAACWVRAHSRGFSETSGSNRFPILNLRGAADANNEEGWDFVIVLTDTGPRVSVTRHTDPFSSANRRAIPYGALFDQDKWYFLAIVNDESSGDLLLYGAPDGESLALIDTVSSLGYTSTPPARGLRIANFGPFYGSVFEPQVWDSARTQAELQGSMDDALAGTETDLAFYAPLDGDSGDSITDAVSSEVASVGTEVRVVPDLELDLRETPRPFTERSLRPARDIEVRYRRNQAPLSTEQVAATVSDDQSLDLQQEYRSLRWSSSAISDDYLDARDVVIDSPWQTTPGAQSVLRIARVRFGTGRRFAVLGRQPSAPNRKGVLLRPGSEVRVYGYGDMSTGPVYRTVANSADLDALDCELRLWR